MKSFLAASVFVFAFAFVCGSSKELETKLTTYASECNVTNPVPFDPIAKVNIAVISGEKVECSKSAPEWSHAFCVLQKFSVFDDNGKVNDKEVVNLLIAYDEKLKSEKPLVHARVYHSHNKNKHITDKYEKACSLLHDICEIVYEAGLTHLFQEEENEAQTWNELQQEISASEEPATTPKP